MDHIEINKNIFNSAFGSYSIGNLYVNLIRFRISGDSKSIWLATSTGVIEHQPGTKKFKLLNKELGLSDAPVMVTALEFKDDSLWIGSDHGLIRYSFKYQQSSLYDHSHGLQNIYIRSIGFFDKKRICSCQVFLLKLDILIQPPQLILQIWQRLLMRGLSGLQHVQHLWEY